MIRIDGKKVKKCFLGDEAIGKVYLGEDLIFQHISRLPAGYTELEYISNPNLGYIPNIGLSGTNPLANKKVEISIRLINTGTSNYIFGAYSSYQRNSSATNLSVELTLYYRPNNINTPAAAGGGSISISDILNQKLDITLDYENLIMSVDGKTPVTIKSPSNMYNNVPMSLFSYHLMSYVGASLRSNVYASPSNFEFYSLKISSGGEVLNEWVPCINPDGLVGIYDIVNGVFESSGDATKPLAAGPAV